MFLGFSADAPVSRIVPENAGLPPPVEHIMKNAPRTTGRAWCYFSGLSDFIWVRIEPEIEIALTLAPNFVLPGIDQ